MQTSPKANRRIFSLTCYFQCKKYQILPNFPVRKIGRNAKFLWSFRRSVQIFMENAFLHNIFTPGNQIKLSYFMQCFLESQCLHFFNCHILNLCLRHTNFLKKRLQHRSFPVNFTKFLRTALLQNTSGGRFLAKKLTIAC